MVVIVVIKEQKIMIDYTKPSVDSDQFCIQSHLCLLMVMLLTKPPSFLDIRIQIISQNSKQVNQKVCMKIFSRPNFRNSKLCHSRSIYDHN